MIGNFKGKFFFEGQYQFSTVKCTYLCMKSEKASDKESQVQMWGVWKEMRHPGNGEDPPVPSSTAMSGLPSL